MDTTQGNLNKHHSARDTTLESLEAARYDEARLIHTRLILHMLLRLLWFGTSKPSSTTPTSSPRFQLRPPSTGVPMSTKYRTWC